jgi:biopolymer transport protein ExbD
MGAQLGASAKRGGIVGINVTPMVDVCLVLLVIMMVSATYIVAQTLKVELPKSATSDEAVTTVAKVSVQKDGKMYFNETGVNDDGLREKLREEKAKGPPVNLVISADAAALHGNVVHVIDVAKQEGIVKFAINVERE